MFKNKELRGIISYGSPASPSLCIGIAGEENKDLVIELNRLVLKHNQKNEASILIGASFKLLPKPKIIVSYADTKEKHLGVVYQATNFLFTGTSKARTDMAGEEGKHSRHHLGDKTKRVEKGLLKSLKYDVLDYPK